MEVISLLRQVMKQYQMDQEDSHLIFIYCEKVYDRVAREILWKVLEMKGIRITYIRVIQDMYEGVLTIM